jgi:amino acid transporter
LASFGYQQELKRALTTKDLVIYGMVFMGPLAVMNLFGAMDTVSQGHTVLAAVIAFTAMTFTALSYSKMVQAFPVAGSTYSYTSRAIDSRLGFLAGWAMLLDYAFIPTFLTVTAANYSVLLLPSVPFWVWVALYVTAITAVGVLGITLTAKADLVVYVVMIATVAVFVATAVAFLGDGGGAGLFSGKAVFSPQDFDLGKLMTASAMAVLCYMGFDGITTLSEETRVAAKKIGFAMIVSCLLQTLLFIVVGYLATAVLPDYTAITDPDTAFSEVATRIGGDWLQTLINVVMVVSVAATALTAVTAAARVLYGMGRDRMLPHIFAQLHPKYKTPVYGIVLMSLVTFVGSLTLDFILLAELVTFGALFGFICVNISVVVHFFFKLRERRYIPNLILPALGAGICVWVWFSLTGLCKIVGFAWLGAGVVYLLVRRAISKDFGKALNAKPAASIETDRPAA